MGQHLVTVGPLPAWLDRPRLLGPGDWSFEGERAEARLSPHDAADLAARLRGVGLGGHPVDVVCRPALPRPAVRAARTEDARRRRDTTPGFTRPGTRLDEEGRWSLTPEALALTLGERARRQLGEGAVVLDAGAGSGGNTIGFARAGLRVIAVEQHAARLADLRANVARYGVADRVDARLGDAVRAAAEARADLLFVDPPWGPDWNRERTDLAALPLLGAVLPHAGRFRHTWLKLPPSFDPGEVPDFVPEACFGAAPGDRRRVKFLLLTR